MNQAQIDGDELACRIAECVVGQARPEGGDPREFLKNFCPHIHDGLYRAARAALEYVIGQINAAHGEQILSLDMSEFKARGN